MAESQKQTKHDHKRVEQDAENALSYLKTRGVTNLVHFTTIENLPSIFEKGLVPRSLLEKENCSFQFNDTKRLDARKSSDGKKCINLSLTNPNIGTFKTFRLDNPDRVYVVLTVKPEILIDDSVIAEGGCLFYKTNAASKDAIPCNIENLFSEPREAEFKDEWPTDNQAEVLVPSIIDPNYIKSVQIRPGDREFFEDISFEAEKQKLPCKVFVNDEFYHTKNYWDRYFNSWQAGFDESAQAENAILSLEQITEFDSKGCHSKELESCDRSVRYKWRMKYFEPRDAEQRNDNELSAMAVTEKIIHRGKIAILSQNLEDSIDRAEINRAHQVQSVIVELLKHQIVKPGMSLHFKDTTIPKNDNCLDTARKALNDLKELCSNICKMYRCGDFLDGLSVVSTDKQSDLVIKWGDGSEKLRKNEVEILPVVETEEDINFDFTTVQKPVDVRIERSILTFFLKYIFRFNDFRENQIDGIIRGLERQDSIVLLPTGSGKSIIFQLLSLITPGIAFVVAPITALIEDQIINLQNKGIDRVVGLTSQVDKDERKVILDKLPRSQYLICYVTPERFQSTKFKNTVERYARFNIVSVIAIDEAHCVSEWGHDFRVSYLGLARTCRDICKTGDEKPPPLLALTGTASSSVLADIKHDLEIIDDFATIQPASFDRPEIHYRVLSVQSENKPDVLDDIVRNRIPNDFNESANEFYLSKNENGLINSGIVFCLNVNGPYGLMTKQNDYSKGNLGVWDQMNNLLPELCGIYSGGKPKRWVGRNWNKAKRETASRFKKNDLSVMVATKAFGMGIDKPNVRWIIHYGMPPSLEAYYQEVGRAARDGETAYAYLILSDDFPELNRSILDPSQTRAEKITQRDREKEKYKRGYKGDDISKAIYFHTQNFEGIDKEIQLAQKVLDECAKQTNRFMDGQWWLPFEAEDNKTEMEKAIYRFTLLGVFEGYSIEYDRPDWLYDENGTQGFGGWFVIDPIKESTQLRETLISNYLNYISAYQSDRNYLERAKKSLHDAVKDITSDRDFIIKVLDHLLENFTYKIVEEGRRTALSNMLSAASKAAAAGYDEADSILRGELLSYLSSEKNDNKISLQSILHDAININTILRIIEDNPSSKDWHNLVGQTSRLLEAYPQHYSFYLIRTIESLLLGEYELCKSSLRAAAEFGQVNYGLELSRCFNDFLQCLNSKIAQTLTAEDLDEVLPAAASLFKIDEMDLICRLESEQADILREINQMVSIVSCIEEGRKWKQAN